MIVSGVAVATVEWPPFHVPHREINSLFADVRFRTDSIVYRLRSLSEGK